MVKVNIDTNKIKNCGTNIMQLAVDYSEQIEGLFAKLEKVTWSGRSADEFVIKVGTEKMQYIKFKNNIYNEGKFLCNCALKLEEITKDIKR